MTKIIVILLGLSVLASVIITPLYTGSKQREVAITNRDSKEAEYLKTINPQGIKIGDVVKIKLDGRIASVLSYVNFSLDNPGYVLDSDSREWCIIRFVANQASSQKTNIVYLTDFFHYTELSKIDNLAEIAK